MSHQRTVVETSTSTKTRTRVAVGLIALAGIAAYAAAPVSSLKTQKAGTANPGIQQLIQETTQKIGASSSGTGGQKGTGDTSATCLSNCDYTLNKCLTYQSRLVCQSEATVCRTNCAQATTPVPPVPPVDPKTSAGKTQVGALQVAPAVMPDAGILVPRAGRWETLARYQVTASAVEDASIRRIVLANLSRPSEAVAQFAIVHNGNVLGTANSISGNAPVDVDLLVRPIEIRAGASETFEVRAMLAPYVQEGVTRPATGNSLRAPEVRVGLAEVSPGSVRVEAVGRSSMQPLVATATSAGLDGRPFVVRNAVPLVTERVSGLSTSLAAGERSLYRVQVGAPVRPIALKKLAFRVTARANSAEGLRLSNFTLYRNGSAMSPSAVQILSGSGVDLRSATNTLSFPSRPQTVVVLFTNEERIEGAGNTYTLSARVGGSLVAGDSLQTEFQRSYNVDPYMTAALSRQTVSGASIQTYPMLDPDESFLGVNMNFDNGYPPRGNAGDTIPANFIWSDYGSISRHSARPEAAGGSSSDWINEAFVGDLATVHIISR